MLRRVLSAGLAALALAAAVLPARAAEFRKYNKVYSVGAEPCDIVAADLTGDGIPEIVTADRGVLRDPREERPANNELSLLMATERLEYTRESLPTGFGPYCIEVANVDGYKALDLVVACFHAARNENITLLRNLLQSEVKSFAPERFVLNQELFRYQRMRDTENRPVYTKPGLTSIVVRDFDHDGFRDAVAAGWSSDVLLYLPGHRERYFGAPRPFRAPGGPREICAQDLDGDGEEDLAVTLYASDQVAVWKGDGKGGFELRERFLSRSPLPHRIRSADMNGDGKQDLVVSHCYAADSVAIYYGEGDLKFPASQEILLSESKDRGRAREILEHEIRDIAVGDLDGDGRPDIAAACFASGEVNFLFNASKDEGIPQRFNRERHTYEDAKPRSLCVADFNGDEKQDVGVALWGTSGGMVTFLLNQ